jgi:hypothetical protein
MIEPRRSGMSVLGAVIGFLAAVAAEVGVILLWLRLWTDGDCQSGGLDYRAVLLPSAFAAPFVIHFVIDRLISRSRRGAFVRAAVTSLLLGVFAGINIPSLLNAPQASASKKTLASLRQITDAIEAAPQQLGSDPARSVAELEKRLGIDLPESDGWRRPFVILFTADDYWIISHGRCGVADVASPAEYEPGTTTDWAQDLVVHNGLLIRHPEGMRSW